MDHVKIGLVDDDPLLLENLPLVLLPQGIHTVWAAVSAEAALEKLQSVVPEVLLVDVDMPGMTGLELVPRLAAAWPGLPVVMLTALDSPELLRRICATQVRGMIIKSDDPATFAHLIRLAKVGQPVFSATPLRQFMGTGGAMTGAGAGLLTPRQREVLVLAADGLTNRQIARQLGCGIDTVKKHFVAINERLGTNSRANAVAEGIRNRIV